jgi:hypothetical protein
MRKALDPAIDLATDNATPSAETREIVTPHDPNAGPVTAIRNVVIQSSLAELKAHGHYERYTPLIAPDALEQLTANVGPGWVALQLALLHYEACDKLGLSPEQFSELGAGVGDRVQDTVLVSSAKKERPDNTDPWQFEGQLHRMWPRVFQGGSVQVVKLNAKCKLLEERGFVLTRYHYYRQAHLAALRAAHTALGTSVSLLKVDSYDALRDELVVRIAWH